MSSKLVNKIVVITGSTRDQGEGYGGIEAPCPETAQEIKNEGYSGTGGNNEQHCLGSAYLSGNDSEGYALVSCVQNGEVMVDDLNRAVEGERAYDEVFSALVKDDNSKRHGAGNEVFVSGF